MLNIFQEFEEIENKYKANNLSNFGKKMSRSFAYWPEKSGFAVVYNRCLRDMNKEDAMQQAKGIWEALTPEEKQKKNKVAKMLWRLGHPAQAPVQETPEERAM